MKNISAQKSQSNQTVVDSLMLQKHAFKEKNTEITSAMLRTQKCPIKMSFLHHQSVLAQQTGSSKVSLTVTQFVNRAKIILNVSSIKNVESD